MLIHNIGQLVTPQGGPQRGRRLGTLEIIPHAALVVQAGRIVALGTEAEIAPAFPNEPRFDAQGRAVVPGLVDPHTHALWAGERAAEFEMRLEGKTYLEILQAGGGILSTVQATRRASVEALMAETRPRLLRAFAHGATTLEVKTGYGLATAAEFKMLEAILALDDEGPWELVPTFLAAHAIPPEFEGRADDYARLICRDMLPALKEWWQVHGHGRPLPFVDVFCETGAFDLEQTRCILETAQALGFPLKVHADEFDNLGGAALAADLGAASADHLVATSEADIRALAASDTVAVALPCTPFGLAEAHYTPAKAILEADGLLALATDCNPGTAWCESMPFAMALACRAMGLTPAQALAAATINAAAAVQRADRLGSLEIGKQADFLILETPDYRHLAYRFGANVVAWVVKRGRFYRVEGGLTCPPLL